MEKTKKITSNFNLDKMIADAVVGIVYLSETDAEIIPFNGGQTKVVTAKNVVPNLEKGRDRVVEQSFAEFFEQLVKVEKWFGDDELKMTQKFAALKKLLEENLRDLKVFRVGKIGIDIYVVGLDGENILRGIQTKAVET